MLFLFEKMGFLHTILSHLVEILHMISDPDSRNRICIGQGYITYIGMGIYLEKYLHTEGKKFEIRIYISCTRDA